MSWRSTQRGFSSAFSLGALRGSVQESSTCPPAGRSVPFTKISSASRHRNHSGADFTTDRTSLTPKMSDEEITYAAVRFHKSSSELQNGGKPDETQGPREAGYREWSVSWHLIAIPLGILCSILLVAVAVLVKHILQYSQEKHELQKTLNNLHQEYSTVQNDNDLSKEMLRNKSIEYDALKDHLDTLNREQSRYCGETKVVLDCTQRTGKHVEGHWFCCGIKCYYFIMDDKHWNGCKQTCQNCSLSLLNIEDDNELKFLQLQVNPNSYWFGLKYDVRKQKWQWIDDGPSKLDLMTVKSLQENGGCAYLSFIGIQHHDCGIKHPCICEKRMDKLPDSVCSMKEK